MAIVKKAGRSLRGSNIKQSADASPPTAFKPPTPKQLEEQDADMAAETAARRHPAMEKLRARLREHFQQSFKKARMMNAGTLRKARAS